jgi:DNA-binding PadR family transcriptional regulator
MPRFGGRRRVGRGDVRGAILRLLAEGGSWNGYQIIQELTNRSGDAWKPSPGSIYPALQQLQDEGLILAEEQDNKRSYSLTEEGKTAAAKLGDDAAPWEVAAEGIDTDAAELRNLIPQVNVATMQVIQAGSKAQIERAKELLTATRRSLYRILADDEPATE